MLLGREQMSPREKWAFADNVNGNLAAGESVGDVAVTLETVAGVDVSGTNLTGSATESEGIITSPLVHDLTAGTNYKLRFSFDIGSNVGEDHVLIRCKDV